MERCLCEKGTDMDIFWNNSKRKNGLCFKKGKKILKIIDINDWVTNTKHSLSVTAKITSAPYKLYWGCISEVSL